MTLTRLLLAWLCCWPYCPAAQAAEQRDEAKLLQYQHGAAQGDLNAMFQLGLLYSDGLGVTQNYSAARDWFDKAASGGDADAMENLGILYANGLGVPVEYGVARSWFEKAIAKGNAAAMTSLGTLYANGQGVARDYDLAKGWYEKAAAGGNVDAMRNLGILYDYGLGVAQDYVAALSWYEKAAAGGNMLAMRYLGTLYAQGHGVTQNYAAARSWYTKAAGGGDAVAMLEAGILYAKGRGVTQDYAAARGWFERAAASGNTKAMVDLGILYANGQGVTQNYEAARSWYEKAANDPIARPVNRDALSPCDPLMRAANNLGRSPCTTEALIKYQSALIISLTIGSGDVTCSGEVITASGIVATANHCLSEGSALQVVLDGHDTRPAEIVGQNVKTDIALLKIRAEKGEFMKLPSSNVSNEGWSSDSYFSYAYPLGVKMPHKLMGDDFKWTEIGSFVPPDSDPLPDIDYEKAAIEVYSYSQPGVSGALFVDATTQLPLGMAILSSKSEGITLLIPWSNVEYGLNSLKQ